MLLFSQAPSEFILHSCHLLNYGVYVLPCAVLLVISYIGHSGPHPAVSN